MWACSFVLYCNVVILFAHYKILARLISIDTVNCNLLTCHMCLGYYYRPINSPTTDHVDDPSLKILLK